MKQTAISLALFSVLSGGFMSTAHAHARWKLDGNTPPRVTNDGIKTGPCGGFQRSATPKEFMPGQTIEVQWEETINHTGYYIISFSPANDQGFEENILKPGTELPDNQNGQGDLPHIFSTQITLPDMECDQCTLQLIQFMDRTQTNYFSCADIKLVANPNPNPEPEPEPEAPTDEPVNLSEKSLVEVAQILLDDFDAFDSDSSATLSYEEIAENSDLTEEQFADLDLDNTNLLDKQELTQTAENEDSTSNDSDEDAGNEDESGDEDNTESEEDNSNNSEEGEETGHFGWLALLIALPRLRYKRR